MTLYCNSYQMHIGFEEGDPGYIFEAVFERVKTYALSRGAKIQLNDTWTWVTPGNVKPAVRIKWKGITSRRRGIIDDNQLGRIEV